MDGCVPLPVRKPCARGGAASGSTRADASGAESESGCLVFSLFFFLIEGGVEVIHIQNLVNGIDYIADWFAGRSCIDLDIDRQSIKNRQRYLSPSIRLTAPGPGSDPNTPWADTPSHW
jgi:hypothetical protein